MSTPGGPITDFSIKGRLFTAAADSDVSRKEGGRENEIEMNGDGTARVVQSLAGWKVDGINGAYKDDRGDLSFLQEIADSGEQVNMTFTWPGNVTFGAKGTIIGEIVANTKNLTVALVLSGGGKLKQQ